MKRLLAATTAVAATTALTLSATPAQAAVGNAKMLTASQVKGAFGGNVSRTTKVTTAIDQVRNCRSIAGPAGKSGRMADFTGSKAAAQVQEWVVPAKSLRAAKTAVASFRKAQSCAKINVAGTKFKSKKIAMPAVGQQRAALRLSMSGIYFDMYMIRKNSTVIAVTVVWNGSPKSAKANALVKKAVAKI